MIEKNIKKQSKDKISSLKKIKSKKNVACKSLMNSNLKNKQIEIEEKIEIKLFPNYLINKNKKGNCVICKEETNLFEESSIENYTCNNCINKIELFNKNSSKNNEFKNSSLKNLIYSYLTIKTDINDYKDNLLNQKNKKLLELNNEKRIFSNFIYNLEKNILNLKKNFNIKFKKNNDIIENKFNNYDLKINKLENEYKEFENEIINNYKTIIEKIDTKIFLKIFESRNFFLLKIQEQIYNLKNSFNDNLMNNEIIIKDFSNNQINNFIKNINNNEIDYLNENFKKNKKKGISYKNKNLKLLINNNDKYNLSSFNKKENITEKEKYSYIEIDKNLKTQSARNKNKIKINK